jgi:hypothetical protein
MDFDPRLELSAAVIERNTLRQRLEQVSGTPAEIDAYVEMHAAEIRAQAFDRYLHWSDETPIGAEPHPSREELEAIL